MRALAAALLLVPSGAGAAGRVMVIGDSHTVGAFGRLLDRSLRATPVTAVSTYGAWGSSPDWWLTDGTVPWRYFFRGPDGEVRSGSGEPTPSLAALLASDRPELTVVALGANQHGAPSEHVRSSARRLAEAVAAAGSACLWVGPPQGRNKPEPELSRLVEDLRAGVEGLCAFYDSRPLTPYPARGGDGIHFDAHLPWGWRTARAWAAAVLAEILSR